MISNNKSYFEIDIGKSILQGLNILPGGGFCNSTPVVFEKELMLAYKSHNKVKNGHGRSNHVPEKAYRKTQTNHITVARSKSHDAHNSHSIAKEGSSGERPLTGEAENIAGGHRSDEHPSKTTRKTVEETLNHALLLLGLTPEEADKLIHSVQEGDFTGLDMLLARIRGNGQNGIDLHSVLGTATEKSGNQEAALRDILASLQLKGSTRESENLNIALKEVLAAATKPGSLLPTNRQGDLSFLFNNLSINSSLLGAQDLTPAINSSMAFFMTHAAGQQDASSLTALNQMIQTFLSGSTGNRNKSVDIGDIASRFNLSAVSNQAFGFTNLPTEEVPLIMDVSFVDQLASRLVNMATMGRQQLTFAIEPPQLGSLKVLIRAHQGNIQSIIQAASEDVKELLDSRSHHLKQILEQQGLNLTDFKVTLAPTTQPGETWNFGWDNTREGRRFQEPRERQNPGEKRQGKKGFEKELNIIT